MNHLPPDIQARREVEDEAAKLGLQRAALNTTLAENTASVKELLAVALDVGVTMETIATLTGISRQTLHQWRKPTQNQRAAWLTGEDR
jgi:ParB-like chromosome segregation protein Spo0J